MATTTLDVPMHTNDSDSPVGPQRRSSSASRCRRRAGDKRFTSLVELLETDRGDALVRVAYSTDGTARRGPVTLRARDLERCPQALAKSAGARRGARSAEATPRRLRRATIEQRRRASRGSARRRSSRAAGRPRAPGAASGRTRCPSVVQHAGDVGDRAVRVLAGRVAEQRSARPRRARASSSSSANQQPSPCLTGIVSGCPRSQRDVNGVSVRSTVERDVAADERERRVRAQRAREQAGLGEDLEAVADAEHEPAVAGERRRPRA